jgi:hypothetical protein
MHRDPNRLSKADVHRLGWLKHGNTPGDPFEVVGRP